MSQTVEVRFKGTRKAYFAWGDEADPITTSPTACRPMR